MARIDDLRPDQRAALQLLLLQERSYDDIASLLRIEPSAVRERAHAALDSLGPDEVAGLSLEQQDEIADYLLGQQSASQRARTRAFLEESAPGRAWGRAVAGLLREMAPDNLPEIPAEATETHEAFEALEARSTRREQVERSSKVGGAILIVAAVVAVFGLVALGISVLGGDDEEDKPSASGNTTPTTQTNQGAPRVIAQINLQPPEGSGGKQAGVAQIAEQQGTRAVALVAEGFEPARQNPPRFYALWVYKQGGPSRRLGFPPQPGKDGRLAVSFAYPKDAQKFDTLIVTQETQKDPKEPGTILLSGPLQGTPVSGDAQTNTTPTTPEGG